MYCKKCGSRVDSNSNFCTNCGTIVNSNINDINNVNQSSIDKNTETKVNTEILNNNEPNMDEKLIKIYITQKNTAKWLFYLIFIKAISSLLTSKSFNIKLSIVIFSNLYPLSFILKFSQVKFKVSTLNKSAYFISTSYI